MVVARNEDTGATGVFPVVGTSVRQATDILHLTLARMDGSTTVLGVTTAHPVFVQGAGWIFAGDLTPGDAIRDKNLEPLTVISITQIDTPQLVYNFEVAEAHTYFAGEFEAWSHNAKSSTSGNSSAAQIGRERHCQLGDFLGDGWETEVPLGKAGRADAVNFGSRTVVELKPRSRRSRDCTQLARYISALEKKYGGKWTGIIMRYKQ